MHYVKGVSFRYKINGILSKPVKPERGLRQGDPLSPYLFIIALDTLSHMFKKAELEDRIKGLVIGEGAPRISHMFFADDIVIAAKVDQAEIFEFMNILSTFSIASRQRINVAKFGVIFGKCVSRQTKIQVCSILNV